MDDKELIKRIMEEVKDEKLREELLALVVEKNKQKDNTKQEEEEPINYLAKLAILSGATEEVAKVGWKIAYIFFSLPLIILGPVALFLFLAFLFTLFKDVREAFYYLFIAIFVSIPALIGALGVYSLRSGKKEYEKLKRKRENQGQS
jgi:ABC-type Na+ efflux pump permease subunit